MSGQPHDPERPPDHLRDESTVLSRLGQHLEKVVSDGQRPRVRTLMSSLPETAHDGLDEWRGYLACDWLIRTWLPAWLDADPLRCRRADLLWCGGRSQDVGVEWLAFGDTLRGLDRIVDVASARQAGLVVLRPPIKQPGTIPLTHYPAELGPQEPAVATGLDVASAAAWRAVPDTAGVVGVWQGLGATRERAVWAERKRDVWNAGQDAVWEVVPPAARDRDVWTAAQDLARDAVASAAQDVALPAARAARAAWDDTWVDTRNAETAAGAARGAAARAGAAAAQAASGSPSVWATIVDPAVARSGIAGVRDAFRRRRAPEADRAAAVYSATVGAVQSRLRPTVAALQDSAVALLRDMIKEQP
jgi:hypothetical protein